MVETTDTRDSYEINDFSAVNQFIDDEKKFAQSFRSKIRAAYIRMGLMSLSIFIVCLGIFLLLAAYAYHIYKSEKVIEKVIVEERVVNDSNTQSPFQQIENNREERVADRSNTKDSLQQMENKKNSISKEYTIFSHQTFVGENQVVYDVYTGNKFLKDEYDKPYRKYCYTYGDGLTRINLYESQYSQVGYYSKYHPYISSSDFKTARSKCLMNEY